MLKRISLAVFALAFVLSCASPTESPDFSEANSLAEEQFNSPEVATYFTDTFRARFTRALGSSTTACLVSTTRSSSPFRFIAVISASGAVERTMVSPQTRYSRCVARSMSQQVFPEPPIPDLHVAVNVDTGVE